VGKVLTKKYSQPESEEGKVLTKKYTESEEGKVLTKKYTLTLWLTVFLS
jgi:hypothetical protein